MAYLTGERQLQTLRGSTTLVLTNQRLIQENNTGTKMADLLDVDSVGFGSERMHAAVVVVGALIGIFGFIALASRGVSRVGISDASGVGVAALVLGALLVLVGIFYRRSGVSFTVSGLPHFATGMASFSGSPSVDVEEFVHRYYEARERRLRGMYTGGASTRPAGGTAASGGAIG